MRHCLLIVVVTLPFVGSGCSFAEVIRKNIAYSPLYAFTEKIDHHRHEQLAHEGWLQMATRYPDYEYSCDYRRGFVDGFADYLDYGGSGDPPPIPPPGYRLSSYETPAGIALMEEWTAGFRHGAATAKMSGLRNLATIPVYNGPTYPTATVNPPRARPPVETAPRPVKLEPAAAPKQEPVKPPVGDAPPGPQPPLLIPPKP